MKPAFASPPIANGCTPNDRGPDRLPGVGQARRLAQGLRGGVVVRDHFKPYYRLAHVRHALCNAHHLRELKALIDIDKEQWAWQMRDLLLEAGETAAAHCSTARLFKA